MEFVGSMGKQNILHGVPIHHDHAELALRQSMETDWSWTPGFIWYDFDTRTIYTMLAIEKSGATTRHQLHRYRHAQWKKLLMGNFVSERLSSR